MEPVAVCTLPVGLQQACFILEMKTPRTDARHCGYFFDCVSHRFFSAEAPLVPPATLHSRGSRNVRVKGKGRKVGRKGGLCRTTFRMALDRSGRRVRWRHSLRNEGEECEDGLLAYGHISVLLWPYLRPRFPTLPLNIARCRAQWASLVVRGGRTGASAARIGCLTEQGYLCPRGASWP